MEVAFITNLANSCGFWKEKQVIMYGILVEFIERFMCIFFTTKFHGVARSIHC